MTHSCATGLGLARPIGYIQAARWPSLTSSRSFVHSIITTCNLGSCLVIKRNAKIFIVVALFVTALIWSFHPLLAARHGRREHPVLRSERDNKSFDTDFHKKMAARDDVLALYCDDQGWPGRLGNNIMSVLAAATEACFYGMQFGVKDCHHDILNLTSLQLPESKEIMRQLSREQAFYRHFVKYVGTTRRQDRGKHHDAGEFIFPAITPCISKDIVRPMLAHLAEGERKYSEDALVIHIRSGDIIRRTTKFIPFMLHLHYLITSTSLTSM